MASTELLFGNVDSSNNNSHWLVLLTVELKMCRTTESHHPYLLMAWTLIRSLTCLRLLFHKISLYGYELFLLVYTS